MHDDKNVQKLAASGSINRQTLKHFWSTAWSFKCYLLTCLLILVNTVCATTLIPFYIGHILAALGRPGQNPEQYLPYLVILVVVSVVTNYFGFQAFMRLQPNAAAKLQREALDLLLKRSVGFHNNHVSGKLVTDANEYSEAFMQLSGIAVTVAAPFLLTITIGTIIVLASSWLLGLIVLVMTVSIIVLAVRQTIKRSPQRAERHKARQELVAHVADTLSNSQTVKTFANESAELEEHCKRGNKLLGFQIRDWTQISADGTKRIAVLLCFQIVFLAVLIKQVEQDPALISIGIFTFSYVINLSTRLFEIGPTFRTVEDALLRAQNITSLLHQDPEVKDVAHAAALQVSAGRVELDAVRFQYQDSASPRDIFSELDLEIEAGTKVGLVGPSGSGKTTLSKLLLRFEDIQSGRILIDGQDISQVTQQSLRQAIAYVPQEPLLFHRTIAENIAYGQPDVTDAAIRQAAVDASALDFIEGLPQGFSTIVGERGVKLSGGQRQRIAIARAMLKNAPILILDEATSALDSESEVLIQSALWKLMEGRTAIVIAHRLSTIQHMDRIVVMDNGRIVEQGSHQELLGTGGTYAKLWSHQSGGFIED